MYISYSSRLSEDNKLIIDKKVSRNRKKVCIVVKTLASNAKDKIKKVSVVIILGGAVYFSNVESSEAIGLSMPPSPIVRLQPNYKDRYKIKVAPTVSPKLDKITFIKYRQLPPYIYMMDERFLKTSGTIKLINKIRGGSLFDIATALVIIVVMSKMMGVGIEGFIINNPTRVEKNPNRMPKVVKPNPFQPQGGHLRYPPVYNLFSPRKTSGSPRSGSTLQITRPSSMPNLEFVELTKEEKRALPNTNDMKIIHEGRPELEVGFWQSKFKVGDHGAIHDLPYTVKSNGGTKTEKSDDNTLKMMRSIVDMPNRDNVN